MKNYNHYFKHQKMLLHFLFSISLITICTINSMQQQNNPVSQILSQETISKPLFSILDITGIKHNGTLSSIVEATQKSWLRKEGSERWEMGNQGEELRDQLLSPLKSLGVIDKIEPSQKEI